ncbi:MAG: helix-turn-helix domain-containing protein [Bacteroidota bacterium]
MAISGRAIIARLCLALQIEDQRGAKVELAKRLQVSKNVVANWYMRDRVTLDEIAEFCDQEDIDLNWVILGRNIEPMNLDLDIVGTSALTDPISAFEQIAALAKNAKKSLQG